LRTIHVAAFPARLDLEMVTPDAPLFFAIVRM
jgi:hypothetical protein